MRSSAPGRALGVHAPLASAHGADCQARADSGARDACPPRGRRRVALWEAGSAGCGGLASAEAASPGTGRAGLNWALGGPGQPRPCPPAGCRGADQSLQSGALLPCSPVLPSRTASPRGLWPAAPPAVRRRLRTRALRHGDGTVPRARLLPRLLQTPRRRARARVVLFPPTVTRARARIPGFVTGS